MSWFRNISFAPRLLSAVGFLVVVIALVAAAGLSAVSLTLDSARSVKQASEMLQHAGHGTANLLSYARAVEFLPLELPAEQRRQFQEQAVDASKLLERRLDQIKADDATGRFSSRLAVLRKDLEIYRQRHAQVLAAAEAGDLEKSGRLAFEAAPVVAEMRATVRQIEDAVQMQFEEQAAAMETSGGRAFWTVGTVGTVGAVVGLLFAV